jgi:uncharacterized protein (TIGR03437 family)
VEKLVSYSLIMRPLLLSLILGQAICNAQPFIYSHAIYNAASSLPFGIPAGTIAQGSIFSIYGRNLGPTVGVQASSFPLGNSISGVSVIVTDGIISLNAIPVYVSASQVNAIMPSNAPTGSVSVRVLVNNGKSNSVPVRVGTNSLGLFTVRGTSAGPGVIFNYVSQTSQPLNSLQTPAKPGQVVTLWGTGLGPVAADNVAPAAGDLPVKVEVFVAGAPAATTYSGRSPCCAGDDQIVFQVPSSSPTGCWVPVNVRLAGTVVSNTVTMAITPDGSSCVANAGSVAKAFIQGGNVGLLAPLRSDMNQDTPNAPLNLRSDFLVARFGQEKGGTFAFNPLVALPPAGTCTAYAGTGDWFTSADLPSIAPEVRALDAGGGTVSGGGKSASYGVPFSPLTLGFLGALNPANPSKGDTTLLAPGSFNIQIAGGADVPAFKTPFTMISPVTWTNQADISTVDRSTGFTVTWSGGTGQTVAVVGGNVDLPTNASGVFVCVAAPGATSITVPSLMLSNLPPGRGSTHYSKGTIFLVAGGTVSSFSASGVNQGLLVPVYVSGKAVAIQ